MIWECICLKKIETYCIYCGGKLIPHMKNIDVACYKCESCGKIIYPNEIRKFRTVLADPPWNFNDKLDKTRTLPYEALTIGDLRSLNIEDIVDSECHLYLWCPSTLVDEGIDVVKKWGFKYKTLIVWEKITKHDKKWFGMGRYFRNTCEVCLFGTRGNLKTRTNNTRNSFEAPSFDAKKPDRHHSAKPNEMYEIIEANSYPPYLELFATQKRKNWVSIGYEIDGEDIRDIFYKYF